MKRVYLFCSAGMSTSMLASKMQDVANSHDLPIEVEAFPDGKIGQIIDETSPGRDPLRAPGQIPLWRDC